MLTAYFPSVYTKGMNSSYITALPDDWERVARVFSAMGDATRQKILLLFEPGESISLSSLVATVGLSRTAVSHHVNVLVRAGLLIPRRQGRVARRLVVEGAVDLGLQMLGAQGDRS